MTTIVPLDAKIEAWKTYFRDRSLAAQERVESIPISRTDVVEILKAIFSNWTKTITSNGDGSTTLRFEAPTTPPDRLLDWLDEIWFRARPTAIAMRLATTGSPNRTWRIESIDVSSGRFAEYRIVPRPAEVTR